MLLVAKYLYFLLTGKDCCHLKIPVTLERTKIDAF